MVSIIYNGNDKINFQAPGVAPKFGLIKGDLIEGIPQDVYDSDLKDNAEFTLVSERVENKMEKSTKGAKS